MLAANPTEMGRARHSWLGLLVALSLLGAPLAAQVRVDHGKHTRLQRFARDAAYGTAEGLAFAAFDRRPTEWGTGTVGYEKRAASNVGEFLIQEGTTEGLAAAMKHSLDYTRCACRAPLPRIGHALLGGVLDEAPSGAYALAVPRIVGAYTGAFAQSTWRPQPGTSRARLVLANGTTSLAIGMAINLFHEFVK
jgi:hypothetical protein